MLSLGNTPTQPLLPRRHRADPMHPRCFLRLSQELGFHRCRERARIPGGDGLSAIAPSGLLFRSPTYRYVNKYSHCILPVITFADCTEPYTNTDKHGADPPPPGRPLLETSVLFLRAGSRDYVLLWCLCFIVYLKLVNSESYKRDFYQKMLLF